MDTAANKASCDRTITLTSKREAPTEFLIFPAGRIDARDGRWWINDRPDLVIAEFEHDGMPLPIDYDHATELAPIFGQPAPAAGWVNALEERNGELWAKVEWTERAAEMIVGGEYRFVSPVFLFDDDNRILSLVSVALTNQPAIRQSALAHKQRAAANHASQTQEPIMKDAARKALCTSLDLADQASDEAIQTAVNALKGDRDKALASARTPDVKQFVPRADHDQVVKERDDALKDLAARDAKAVEDIVDRAIAAKKVPPSSRGYHIAACQKEGGVEAFQELVGELPDHPVTQPSGLDGKDPPKGDDTPIDPVALASAATDYQTAMAAKGTTVAYADAVAHAKKEMGV